MLFSREATPIYIPTTVHKGPLPSTSLLTRPSFHFGDGHSDRWGDSSLRFWFAMSLMMNEVEHLFIDLLVNCVPSFGKCLFRYFAHFNLFLAIELYVVHCSVALVSDSLWPHGLQHTRLPCASPTPGACSNSCPLSQWCHPTISSSVIPFSSCLQSFPASESFPMNQFFISGSQSIGVSASASVLPVNIQDWFPLAWTDRFDLLAVQGTLSRVFSTNTVQRHQFFSTQLSL